MADVFISYSRKDKDFVSRLHDGLAKINRDTWVDWEGIPPTAEWMKEIYSGIESADTFIFIISPDSVASQVCGQEIDHAVKCNKRLVPIVCRDVDAKAVHRTLAALNWIFFREGDNFDSAFQTLIKALDTDLDYVRDHTRLVTRALEWDREKRDNSFLLRGSDLREAEGWLVQSAEKEPKPTPLQTQYVFASRKAETKRQRIVRGALAFGLIVAVILTVVAWLQRSQAIKQANIALARQLAAQSELTRNQRGGLKLSVQLAAEAMQRLNSIDVHSVEVDLALRRGLALLPRYVTEFDLGYLDVDAIAFSPDGQRLIAANKHLTAQIWEIASRQEIAGIRGEGVFREIVLSPDGRYLATANDYGDGGTAQVWEVSRGQEIGSFEYEFSLNAIALSPNGKYLVHWKLS